jgi:hypothetical protein
MKKLDVFLTGFPRSGTTMMCGLMTSKKNKTWCMSEPSSGGGRIGTVDYAKKVFNIKTTKDTPLAETAELAGVKRWGIKEVDPNKRYGIIRQYAPEKIVVLHRNIIDCTISTLEFLGPGRFPTPESIANYMKFLSDKFMEFLKWTEGLDGVIEFAYDDLMDEEKRNELSDMLDWPFSGDTNLYLVGRHAPEIREGIYNRRIDADRKKYSTETKAAHRACAKYQKRFEYS